MGDLSTEPSMEDILSSIKRIIAEEGDQPARRARAPRAAPAVPLEPVEPVEPVDYDPEEEVLELSDPIPASRLPEPSPEPAPRAAPIQEAERLSEPAPAAEPIRPAEPIVGQQAAAASRGSLEALSRLLVKPEADSDGTLEGLVREMLRPMLREWLDAHLPEMVETLVSREIARIASQAR